MTTPDPTPTRRNTDEQIHRLVTGGQLSDRDLQEILRALSETHRDLHEQTRKQRRSSL